MNFRYAALLLTLAATPHLAAASSDSDQVGYSTEGYCVLAAESMEPRYLAAYAKKLGVTPGDAVCASFRAEVERRPAAWDFRDRRPYPGSAIRLSQAQIGAIRAARLASVE